MISLEKKPSTSAVLFAPQTVLLFKGEKPMHVIDQFQSINQNSPVPCITQRASSLPYIPIFGLVSWVNP
jgi:hypothetical protein